MSVVPPCTIAGSSAYLARRCTAEAFMAEIACCLQHCVKKYTF